MGEIVSQKDIINIVRKGQEEKVTYVVTNGCFDILHVGHVRYLNKTKTYADKLIVMLNSDSSVKKIKGNCRPINNQKNMREKTHYS